MMALDSGSWVLPAWYTLLVMVGPMILVSVIFLFARRGHGKDHFFFLSFMSLAAYFAIVPSWEVIYSAFSGGPIQIPLPVIILFMMMATVSLGVAIFFFRVYKTR